MLNQRRNVIVQKTLAFSFEVIRFCNQFRTGKYFIVQQLMRSATSIGSNVFEAQNAESLNDFIHKMKIAAKEAGETEYWLLLCESEAGAASVKKLRSDLSEIILLLSRIISTCKRKLKQSK